VPGAIVDLGSGLSGCATPRMPAYGSVLEWAFGRLDADPAAFRAFRFELSYPPIPARAVFSSELPPAEGTARHVHDGTRRVSRTVTQP
jgi:hypothetical protein